MVVALPEPYVREDGRAGILSFTGQYILYIRNCTGNLRTRVRTLIDTSQNKVMCYDENEGSYTESDIGNTINNTKVKSKMVYSIKMK